MMIKITCWQQEQCLDCKRNSKGKTYRAKNIIAQPIVSTQNLMKFSNPPAEPEGNVTDNDYANLLIDDLGFGS
jgi:hypothetical protein